MNETPVSLRLKRLRESSGLSVRAMAALAGMKPSTYGHYENPDRFKSPFLPVAEARTFAKALSKHGIAATDVLVLAGMARASDAHDAPGFAAPAVERFDFNPAPAPPGDTRGLLRSFFDISARTPETYRLSASLPGFGLIAGDVLVVDLGNTPAPGDLAIVTTEDEAGNATTLVRRLFPPYLVAGDPAEPRQILRDDEERVFVRWPVVGSFRTKLGT